MRRAVVFLPIVLTLLGCRSEGVSPKVVKVVPKMDAQNVDVNTTIELYFNMPMDTRSCEENFRIYCESMEASGHFEWNVNHDMMTFYPDSLCPDMEHTIYLSKGSMCDMEMEHGAMMGNMNYHQMKEDFISHFKTKGRGE